MLNGYKIFLDMDGVLADFVKGAHAAHNRPNIYELDPACRGTFDIEKCWGISSQKFWQPIHTAGFWRNLDPTPEATELVTLVEKTVGIENVAVLTSPNIDPNCIPEKKEWMKFHFPQLADQMIFARAFCKRMIAAPKHILIDDYDRNIQQWREAGGIGITVPRYWNSYYRIAKQATGFVKCCLKCLPIKGCSSMPHKIYTTRQLT